MWLYFYSHSLLLRGIFNNFAFTWVKAHQHQHAYFMRINNTLHSCTLSPSAQQNNPTSPQRHSFSHLLLCILHVKLHPSSSLLGMMPNPPSSHWHAKHFTPFILSTAPFELTNYRDRLFVESEVWALCHRDYSESLLVISSWEYNLNCAMWLLHDRGFAALYLTVTCIIISLCTGDWRSFLFWIGHLVWFRVADLEGVQFRSPPKLCRTQQRGFSRQSISGHFLFVSSFFLFFCSF